MGDLTSHLIGRLIQVEGDLVVYRGLGDLTPEILDELLIEMQRVQRARGRYFLLVDLRYAGRFPSDLPQKLAARLRDCPPAAVGFFGGDPVEQALGALLVGGLKLLGSRFAHLGQFRTESEARAYIAAERQRLDALPAG
jgi:hypothetical protein